MTLRFTPGGEKVPVRIFLTNESGYYLDISLYKEITDKQTGEVRFESVSSHPGPFHGRYLRTPYLTRDHLQMRRYTAQSHGTTYVYDFPEMFRQALMKIWKDYYTRVKTIGKKNSAVTQSMHRDKKLTNLQAAVLQNSKNELNNLLESKFFSCVELVIEADTGDLVEKNRIPGENTIGKLLKLVVAPIKK